MSYPGPGPRPAIGSISAGRLPARLRLAPVLFPPGSRQVTARFPADIPACFPARLPAGFQACPQAGIQAGRLVSRRALPAGIRLCLPLVRAGFRLGPGWPRLLAGGTAGRPPTPERGRGAPRASGPGPERSALVPRLQHITGKSAFGDRKIPGFASGRRNSPASVHPPGGYEASS